MTETLATIILQHYPYAVLFVMFVISLWGLIFKPNIIKKILCLAFLFDAINTLYALSCWRWAKHPLPAILTDLHPTPGELRIFASSAVDPLPQALVLTAVVIGTATTAALLALAVMIYRHYGTLEMTEIRKLKG